MGRVGVGAGAAAPQLAEELAHALVDEGLVEHVTHVAKPVIERDRAWPGSGLGSGLRLRLGLGLGVGVKGRGLGVGFGVIVPSTSKTTTLLWPCHK